MTTILKVMDYQDPVNEKGTVVQSYTVTTNSYWVTVTKNERETGKETDEVMFERVPQMDEWLDPAHTRITKALSELESAILAVVGKEKESK